MSEEKSVGYVRLVEACDGPGCPVCRCVIEESRGHIRALLYEHVTDPDTRRALRASWGFCNWHTWMLLDVEHAIFGAAIIYEDLLRIALEQTERLDDGAEGARRGWLGIGWRRPRPVAFAERYRQRSACPVCVTAAGTEHRCLQALTTLVDDGDLQAAYARSDGLCLPHVVAALEVSGNRAEVRTLVARTRERWRRLRHEVASFVAKHDYRNRERFTEAEAASSARAFELLAGARSVFGNDARRAPPR
jgi:hypothetical protein